MSEGASQHEQSTEARISNGVVGLLKEFYGRGPERSKAYVHNDLVVVLMRGGFSRVEETLFAAGRGDAVLEQRNAFDNALRSKFSEIIQRETGRDVVAFMSGNHQHPDVHAVVFVLAPSELIDPVSDVRMSC